MPPFAIAKLIPFECASFNVTDSLLIVAGLFYPTSKGSSLLPPVLACRAARLGRRVRAFLVEGSARILGFSVGPYWLKPYFGNKRSNDFLRFEAPQNFTKRQAAQGTPPDPNRSLGVVAERIVTICSVRLPQSHFDEHGTDGTANPIGH